MKKIDYAFFCENLKVGTRFKQKIDNAEYEYVVTKFAKNKVCYKLSGEQNEHKKWYTTDIYSLYQFARYGALLFDFLK